MAAVEAISTDYPFAEECGDFGVAAKRLSCPPSDRPKPPPFRTAEFLAGILEFVVGRLDVLCREVATVFLAKFDEVCAAPDLFLQVSALVNCLPILN